MNKFEFLEKLQKKLKDLPEREVGERINFYSEMIDDRMEEGLSEEDAIQAVGTVDEISYQIAEEIQLLTLPKQKPMKRAWKPWEIVVLILGAPLWVPLLIVAFAVVFVLYVVLWVINACLWAVELPFFIFSLISDGLLVGGKKLSQGSWFLTKKGFGLVKKFCGEKEKQYEMEEI